MKVLKWRVLVEEGGHRCPCSHNVSKCYLKHRLHFLFMQEGLRVLQKNGTVMKCQNSHEDAEWYADVGASAAMLEAGYNMASLQHR